MTSRPVSLTPRNLLVTRLDYYGVLGVFAGHQDSFDREEPGAGRHMHRVGQTGIAGVYIARALGKGTPDAVASRLGFRCLRVAE